MQSLVDQLYCLYSLNTNQCLSPIRLVLFNSLAHDTSPFTLLIDYYYLTALKVDEIKENDPVERALYCTRKLPYISDLAKYGRKIRNALIHRRGLPFNLFENFTLALIEFASKKHGSKVYVNMLLSTLITCYTELINPEPEAYCPLCLQSLPTAQQRVTEYRAKQKASNNNNTITRQASWFRDAGYKEQIKGLDIMIIHHRPKFNNQKGRFKSWHGSNFYCNLKLYGKISLPCKTPIMVTGLELSEDIKVLDQKVAGILEARREARILCAKERAEALGIEFIPKSLEPIQPEQLCTKFINKALETLKSEPPKPETLSEPPKSETLKSETLKSETLSEPPKPKPLPIDPTILEKPSYTETAKWFKENGYREYLKGKIIRIEEGLNAGKLAMFTGWNGTCIMMKMDGKNTKAGAKFPITVLDWAPETSMSSL